MTPDAYLKLWLAIGAGAIAVLVVTLTLSLGLVYWVLGPRVQAKGMELWIQESQEKR